MTHTDLAAEYDKLADAFAATIDPSKPFDTEAALKFRAEARRHRDMALDAENIRQHYERQKADHEHLFRHRLNVESAMLGGNAIQERIAAALEKLAGP